MQKSDMVTIEIKIMGDELPDSSRYSRKQLADVSLEVPAQVANDMLREALLTLFDPMGITSRDPMDPVTPHNFRQDAPSASTGISDPEPVADAASSPPSEGCEL